MNAEHYLFDEALWVMLLGMGVVFGFLGLLVLLMYGSQWAFGKYWPTNLPPAKPPASGDGADPVLLAAVMAAVHRFRSGR